MKNPVFPRLLPLAAGCNQLINWGISFYMPGTFSRAISAEMGWSSPVIYLGLTLAMLMMAVMSPLVAPLLARFGGQRVIMCGTLLIALSCVVMAHTHTKTGWYTAWLMAGFGMRLSLYDALFAALVNVYGINARQLISRVTLAGGLASAVFWPLGTMLLTVMSWRDALVLYALAGGLSMLLLILLPNQTQVIAAKLPASRGHNDRRNGMLYASFIALITFVSSGTSTHLPEFIACAGLPAVTGMLWGIGQTGARLMEVIAGARLTPFRLTLLTAFTMPLCFLTGLISPLFAWSAAGFVLGYGAINGLMTIVKATLPLALFTPDDYARRTGFLLIPAQLMTAVSPFAYAWLNRELGTFGSLKVSFTLTLIIALLAVAIFFSTRHAGEEKIMSLENRPIQSSDNK